MENLDALNNRNNNTEDKSVVRKLATDTAMFLAGRLNAIGIRTEVVSPDHAKNILRNNPDGAEFSVADIQKLNYGKKNLAFAKPFDSKGFAVVKLPGGGPLLIDNKSVVKQKAEVATGVKMANVKGVKL